MTTPTEATLPRVLLVDDEPNVLDALRRQLRRDFSVETAVGAANGLAALGRGGPFAVIVSDFLMPGINGADFLAAARKAAPDTTRMLLTGHANLENAAATVNHGQVLRFLIKPVDHDTMITALRECVEHHRRLVAEREGRELLEQTLHGSVKALTDVLSLTNPAGFARATRVRRLAAAVLDRLAGDAAAGDAAEVPDRWAIELAAMLCQLGAVSLPPYVSEKLDAGLDLSQTERAMVDAVPAVADDLLSPIPRMAPVCAAIRYSRKGFDGSGPPESDHTSHANLPLGGRLLRLLQDYDAMTIRGMPAAEVVATLGTRAGTYDPALLAALTAVVLAADAKEVHGVLLAELCQGMILATDVTNLHGVLLVKGGQEVTASLITRLKNFAAVEEEGVAEPLMVHLP
jgi:response regulator RpfG family c-di-GMP phosphodiesterase